MGRTLPLTVQQPRTSGAAGRAVSSMSAAFLVIALAFAGTNPAAARPAPDSFADLTETVAPAVVNVSVSKSSPAAIRLENRQGEILPFDEDHPFNEFFERFFGRDLPGFRSGPREQRGLGSGFIIDPAGYVVTNHHVIAEADEITVTLHDGRSFEAAVIGQDEKTDLALLKVEADEALPSVAFGDSEAVRPGDWVIAVGNPFGLGGSVTAGIVSARGRALPGGTIIDFLQIDAPINQGNSGGPTFDTEGRVIGVNTAIFSPNGGSVGIGFAIPSNLASQIIGQLRETGTVSRGWLGVRVQTVTPEIAEGFQLDKARGALVSSVTEDSPASRGGLRSGDVILSWDGKTVDALNDLPRLVAFTPIDKTVEVEIWRNGEQRTLEVVTGRAPDNEQVATAKPALLDQDRVELPGTGITVAALTPARRAAAGIDDDVEGVIIVRVAPDSRAAAEGLRRGDVIRSLASKDVDSPKAAAEHIEEIKAEGQEVVTLLISRDGVDTFFALRLRNA